MCTSLGNNGGRQLLVWDNYLRPSHRTSNLTTVFCISFRTSLEQFTDRKLAHQTSVIRIKLQDLVELCERNIPVEIFL